MASVAFEDFLPEVGLEAAGVPDIVAVNAIRNACFDFCRDSLWLCAVGSPVTYSENVQTYTLTPPADTLVVGVLNLNVDGKKLAPPWTLEEVSSVRPDWQSAKGVVEGFVQPSNGVVSLIAVPNAAGFFTPTIAYAPTRTATTVDERVFDYHLESIKYGALWKLKSMVGHPWSDPAGAALYEQRFLMMVGQATIERYRSNSGAAMRVAPRPFV